MPGGLLRAIERLGQDSDVIDTTVEQSLRRKMQAWEEFRKVDTEHKELEEIAERNRAKIKVRDEELNLLLGGKIHRDPGECKKLLAPLVLEPLPGAGLDSVHGGNDRADPPASGQNAMKRKAPTKKVTPVSEFQSAFPNLGSRAFNYEAAGTQGEELGPMVSEPSEEMDHREPQRKAKRARRNLNYDEQSKKSPVTSMGSNIIVAGMSGTTSENAGSNAEREVQEDAEITRVPRGAGPERNEDLPDGNQDRPASVSSKSNDGLFVSMRGQPLKQQQSPEPLPAVPPQQGHYIDVAGWVQSVASSTDQSTDFFGAEGPAPTPPETQQASDEQDARSTPDSIRSLFHEEDVGEGIAEADLLSTPESIRSPFHEEDVGENIAEADLLSRADFGQSSDEQDAQSTPDSIRSLFHEEDIGENIAEADLLSTADFGQSSNGQDAQSTPDSMRSLFHEENVGEDIPEAELLSTADFGHSSDGQDAQSTPDSMRDLFYDGVGEGTANGDLLATANIGQPSDEQDAQSTPDSMWNLFHERSGEYTAEGDLFSTADNGQSNPGVDEHAQAKTIQIPPHTNVDSSAEHEESREHSTPESMLSFFNQKESALSEVEIVASPRGNPVGPESAGSESAGSESAGSESAGSESAGSESAGSEGSGLFVSERSSTPEESVMLSIEVEET